MRFSLKNKISLLFLFAMVGVILITIFIHFKMDFTMEKQVRHFVYASISGAYDRTTKKLDFEELKNGDFLQVEDDEKIKKILKGHDRSAVKQEDRNMSLNSIFRPFIIKYDTDFYAIIYVGNVPKVFQITTFQQNSILPYILFAFMSTLLFLLYFAILKSIRPLNVLRQKIREFSEGRDDIDCKIKGEDEIAEVANEFDAAVKKIRSLREARQLFLRNIMHELKTPITRGKLSVEMLDASNPYRQTLSKVFCRQESLLNEFMRIEQLGAGELKLDKGNYYLNDIVDCALDIIGDSAQNVEIKIDNRKIYADFDLLATAIKNLLDNAILYSSDKKASIKTNNDTLLIANEGKPLELCLEEYKKPFHMKEKREKKTRGLGFGLFISLNIFDLHNIDVEYIHKDSQNIFILTI